MKKKFLKAAYWVRDNWVISVAALAVFILAAGSLRFALFSVPAGASPNEIVGTERVLDYHPPWREAVSAPYYALVNLTELVIKNPVHAARAVSALIGLGVLICFFWLVSLWFNGNIAVFGTIILSTSSWFLHTARAGTDSIMLVAAPLILFVFGTILVGTKRKTWPMLILSVLTALSLYVPYMLWIVAPTMIMMLIKNKRLISKIGRIPKLLAIGLFIIFSAPLIASLVLEPSQIKLLLGIPDTMPTVSGYLKQLIQTINSIGLRSPESPALRLGKLPLLDIFSVAMVVMGIYFYSLRIALRRSLMIFIGLFFSILIISLLGPDSNSIALIMTPVYALIVSGVYETIRQWLRVFPRNPYARSFGISMIVIAVAFTSFYHLQRYYNAWPNAPETKAIYNSGI